MLWNNLWAVETQPFGQLIQLFFAGLVGAGGFAGLYKLFTIRSTNRNSNAKARKTDVEATTMFSSSVLEILRNAQTTANRAQRQADRAGKLANMAQEEVAYLRRWIISQGLVPPEYVHQLEGDEDDYNGAGEDGQPVH